MNIDEQILKTIDKIAEADPGRNILKYRERLLTDIKSRYFLTERRGHIVNRHGVEQDLNQIVGLVVDSASYIPRPTDQAEKMKYVSPWVKPTKEQRERMSTEVRQALEHLVDVHKVVPLDKEALKSALKTLSESMAFGFNEDGKLVFSKVNGNGLFGSQEFTFDEVLSSVSHLVDRRATQLEKELDTAARREVAKKLLNKPNAKDEIVNAKIDELVQRDIERRIPKRVLPRIPKSAVESEFYRREAILRGVDPEVTGGNIASQLRRVAKHEMERLDDVGELQRQLKDIQPQTSTPWEGVSYE